MLNAENNPKQDSNNEFEPNTTETISVSQFEQVEEHFRFGWGIKGRRGRLAYVGYSIFIAILMLCVYCLGVVILSLFTDLGRDGSRFLGLLISFIVLAKIDICNMGRRLHDTNHSAVWAYFIYVICFFSNFIPFVGLILFVAQLYLIFCPGTVGRNTYGDIEPG